MANMSPAVIFAVPPLLLCLLSGCKPESKKPPAETTGMKPPAQVSSEKSEAAYEAILNRLNADIRRLKTDDGAALKSEFVNHSRDSSGGGFFCLGKGVANPKLPEAAQAAAQRRGAEIIARQWALYLKKWGEEEYVSLSRKLSGQITYSRTVYEKREGDTLYTLVAVPLGSIVGE